MAPSGAETGPMRKMRRTGGLGRPRSAFRAPRSALHEVLYCGYRWDPETGLYHVRHRSYHPTLGRWLSRDPIGYAIGMHLYSYVEAAAVSGCDPFGLLTVDDITGPEVLYSIGDPSAALLIASQTLADLAEEERRRKEQEAAEAFRRMLAKEQYSACDMVTILEVSFPAMEEKYRAAAREITKELIVCLTFLESGWNRTKMSAAGAYGLGQLRRIAAADVDDMYKLPRGTTWREMQNDGSAQVAATISFLAKARADYQPTMRGALKHYGPRDVGTGYADLLLDCEDCLKKCRALDWCCKDRTKAEATAKLCTDQVTARVKALGDTTRGYRDRFKKGFDVPPPLE